MAAVRMLTNQALAAQNPDVLLHSCTASSQASLKISSTGASAFALRCSSRSPLRSRMSAVRETRLVSAAAAGVFPMLAFIEAELPRAMEIITKDNDWVLDEGGLKTMYMVFTCLFAWLAVVFASMNDPYYESDEYRDAGGNGTQFWIYERVEEEEEEAREELFREELRREIDDRMSESEESKKEEKDKVAV